MIEEDESGIKIVKCMTDFEEQSPVGRVNTNKDKCGSGARKACTFFGGIIKES